MKTLEGKWALVTGSSRGIGQQIALGLAGRKCNIIVHGREKGHISKTLELIGKTGARTFSVTGDLSALEGIASVVKGVKEGGIQVDILYNNAAVISEYKPIFEITRIEWEKVFMVNVFAMAQLCNAFAPGMKERGYGRIINLSSGIKDAPFLAPYSASKAAVDKFTRDLAFELKGTNVLVNYLDPGWLKTDMGGKEAPNAVETVLPGALVPALLDDNGSTGCGFAAQDFAGKIID